MNQLKMPLTTFFKLTLPGLFVCALLPLAAPAQMDGTGWTPLAVRFDVQSPTNAPQNARYFFTNNIYHCLAYSNDCSFLPGNTTLSRTEMRFTPDFTHGEVQYQALMMAPAGENSYTIWQEHTGNAQSPRHGPVAIMLNWLAKDGGSIWNGFDENGELAKNLGGKWFQLNVEHNLATRTIRVWINQKLVATKRDNRATDYYFKTGVYQQRHYPASYRMETYITNSIQMWTRPATNQPAAKSS